MKRLMHGIATITLWTMIPTDSGAQEAGLPPGTDIRLSVVPSRDMRGTLIGWDADTLRLQDPASGFVQALPTAGIERVRVCSRGRDGSGSALG